MKKVMFGAALAAAMMAPGLASANTSGALELSYENNDFDYGEFWDVELGALVVHDMGGWQLQGEGRTNLQEWDGSSGQYSHSFAAAHGSMDFGGWDGGVYAGLLNYYGDGGYMLGLEGRTAFGNFSVDGSVSHASMSDDNYDGTGVRVGGAFFFTPNAAITAGVSRTDIESGQDYEITELSIGGAFQFANNVTLFGGYTNTDGDRSISSDYEGDTLEIGIRFGLNGGTLQDETNDGAWQSAQRFADTWKRW